MITDRQLVIDNLEDKLKAFTHAVGGELTSEADFVISDTGIPTDTFNLLLPKSPDIKNPAKVRDAIDNFKGFPFCAWTDVRFLNDDWKALMRDYDLEEAERNVMMKLENTLHVGQNNSPQLKIAPVKSNEELMRYKEVFISLFEGSPEKEGLESYFNRFSQAKLGPEVQMFIGCKGELAVTAGLLIESKESYGIYDVMTKEAFRGKGFGSDMFWFLLNRTEDKQKPVVLQASEDGKNIYKRFGFTDVGEMVVFE